jgi:transcriptional regulatory protein RtcR
MKKQVVIGFLGTTLDAGTDNRWGRWRPTVALCQHDDLVVDRLDLLHDGRSASLAARVTADLATVSPETSVCSHICELADPWDFQEVYAALHDFARAYKFDTDNEDYLVHITTGTHVAQICWFLLTEAHYLPARLLQLSPPRRAKENPTPGAWNIIDLDLARYDRIASRFKAERIEGASFLKSGIATRNAAFNHTIDQIEQVAIRSKAPLLMTGPTGAGKSQLARRIYDLKRNRHQMAGEFVAVNCATLRGESAMSALFGHVKGAFTGAAAARPGLLRAADKGMLFLDEIGELGPDEQAMILGAIEEKKFLPVGADKQAASDFQLVAGTNRDLAADIAAGKFREDLFARLNLWSFALPGLADRREDIEPNLDFELRRHADEEGRNIAFNKEARERYLAFALSPDATWRANFRDLGASVTRMATFAAGGRITEPIVADEILRLRRLWSAQDQTGPDRILEALLGETRLSALDVFDRMQLAATIAVCRRHTSLSAAGRALFAASRAAKTGAANDADRLRKYLARFDLDWAAIASLTEAVSAR